MILLTFSVENSQVLPLKRPNESARAGVWENGVAAALNWCQSQRAAGRVRPRGSAGSGSLRAHFLDFFTFTFSQQRLPAFVTAEDDPRQTASAIIRGTGAVFTVPV